MQTESGTSSPGLPAIKGKHAFRLGIPSYVLPADILPNVEAFAPCVDDIELTLFESPDKSPLPSPETIERLKTLARQHELTYTVHFPIDRKLGDESIETGKAFQQNILAIIRLMRPLAPFAWILHLDGIVPEATKQEVGLWQKRISALLPEIIAQAGDPEMICIENLRYPFEWCAGLLDSFKLGACIDIGHLLATGADVRAHLKRFLPKCRVIHLHGAREGKAHQTVDVIPINDFRQYLDDLAGFKGVLTVELFNLRDVESSIKFINRCLGGKRRLSPLPLR